jgi:hypothetical protein
MRLKKENGELKEVRIYKYIIDDAKKEHGELKEVR